MAASLNPVKIQQVRKALGIPEDYKIIKLEICFAVDGFTTVKLERMLTKDEADQLIPALENYYLMQKAPDTLKTDPA